jgi:hypothetical protein
MSAPTYNEGDTLKTANGETKIESINGRTVELGNGRTLTRDGIGQGLHYGRFDIVPAGTGDRDVYIRFGDLPDDGQSTDHSTGRKHCGVSVFGCEEEDGVYHPTGQSVMEVLLLLPRGASLVSGERVGTGADGEPLIRDIEIEDTLTSPKGCGGFVSA